VIKIQDATLRLLTSKKRNIVTSLEARAAAIIKAEHAICERLEKPRQTAGHWRDTAGQICAKGGRRQE